jgi:hypothetical protein
MNRFMRWLFGRCLPTSLGFRCGDVVRNTYQPDLHPNQERECTLVCKIMDYSDGDLWWAVDYHGKMCQVSVGRSWVLSEHRTVWRDGNAWLFREGMWRVQKYSSIP